MIKIPESDSDNVWLNRQIAEHLGGHTFTEKQEVAIAMLVQEIAYGYRHTISRQSWGPGWD